MYSIEFKRAFGRRFYLALLIGCIIATADFVQSNWQLVRNILNVHNGTAVGIQYMNKIDYSTNVSECFMGLRLSGLSYTYFWVLPLLCAIPYTETYSADRNGYFNAYVGRVDAKKYVASKMACSFLSAGLVAVIPLFLNLCICMCFFPLGKPISLVGRYSVTRYAVFQDLFYDNTVIYYVIYFLIVFVVYGEINCISLLATRIEANQVFAYLAPFAVYYVSHTVILWSTGKDYSLLRCAYLPTFFESAVVPFGVQVGVLGVAIICTVWIMRNKDV